MDQPRCKLTLIYPLPIEEEIVNLVLSENNIVQGFTTWRAEGHGQDFYGASPNEKVRGRNDRGVLVSVLPRSALSNLIESARAAFKGSHVAFWVEPVEQFGDFTSAANETSFASNVPTVHVPPRI
jgi:hypothetical protein